MAGRPPNMLHIDTEAVYRVRLQGVLGHEWGDWIDGMHIISYGCDTDNNVPTTMLVGEVADQAALAGVLNLVFTLGLPLLDVTWLGRSLHTRDT